MNKIKAILFVLVGLVSSQVYGQLDGTFTNPKEYIIKGIAVEGNQSIHSNLIVIYTNLSIGKKISIPGNEIQSAMNHLWEKEFFSDIKIVASKIEDGNIWLTIKVQERNRLARYSIRGLSKSESKSLKDELGLRKGQILTESLMKRAESRAVSFFRDKGYYAAKITFTRVPELTPKEEMIKIDIEKGRKVKIEDVVFIGNDNVDSKLLRKQLSRTKRRGTFLKSAKFRKEEYEDEKGNIVKKYNSLGYRDATLVKDSIIQISEKRLIVKMYVSEGNKYYFGDIEISGNTKFRTSFLVDTILNLKKGTEYNQSLLEERLYYSLDGIDISSLYMDRGYLFFNVTPLETKTSGDTIDLEIRIYEGDQARINNVTVKGNTKTSDFVVLRELRTKPGAIFSRSDIQRSMRELSQMGMFNPESLGVNPVPNPAEGTVDIEYTVEERANDQIELSGGFGGYAGFVGSLGLSLNNFSARKIFKPKLWNPLPAGDGQRLSLRAQSNGVFYQSYNASFTEPWLGGKKPNAFSVSIFHNVNSNDRPKSSPNYAKMSMVGASVGLVKRLKWPDEYFFLNYGIGYQRIRTQNYGALIIGNDLLDNGLSHNFNFKLSLNRNETRGNFIFPSGGSEIGVNVQFTPPYSSFDKNTDYSTLDNTDKYKFVEYHKWGLDAAWYTSLHSNEKLVLATKAKFGYLGYYNKDIGASPFERYSIGGSGLGGYTIVGTEFISQRGYPDNSISDALSPNGTNIMDKFTMELRYAISKNPQSTVYVHTFLEAGNSWLDFKDFNPFVTRRAAGAGVRLFLPMFGLIGLDWAYGFDYKKVGIDKPSQFHFFIGQQF